MSQGNMITDEDLKRFRKEKAKVRVFDDKILITWQSNSGKLHRKSGPAAIAANRQGLILTKMWYFQGYMHRDNGPAFRIYYECGAIQREEWWVQGEYLQSPSPAIIEYYRSGEVKSSAHFEQPSNMDCCVHFRGYLPSGKLIFEAWGGKDLCPKPDMIATSRLHRDSEPAVIHYDEDGNLRFVEWWWKGSKDESKFASHDILRWRRKVQNSPASSS